MANFRATRRTVLGGMAALGASTLLPRPAQAKGSVVAAMYPGVFEEAYRQAVAPRLKEVNKIELVLTPLLALDQIAKAQAARGRPPFDAFILDPGPRVTGIERDLFQKLDKSKLKNLGQLPAGFVDDWGVNVHAQIVGLAYNPKKVEAPNGWDDLFSPKYYGKVGLTGFQTTFGTVSLIEIAKIFGGSETNVEPAFVELKKFLPHVGAIGAPLAMPGLFQQGEIDVMYTNYQTTMNLKSRGVDIDFAVPKTGAVAFYTTLHIAKGAADVENAYQYMDVAVGRDAQMLLQKPPFNLLSVNKGVGLQPDYPANLISSHDQMSKFVTHDWTKINPLRAQWIERFNKEVSK